MTIKSENIKFYANKISIFELRRRKVTDRLKPRKSFYVQREKALNNIKLFDAFEKLFEGMINV